MDPTCQEEQRGVEVQLYSVSASELDGDQWSSSGCFTPAEERRFPLEWRLGGP